MSDIEQFLRSSLPRKLSPAMLASAKDGGVRLRGWGFPLFMLTAFSHPVFRSARGSIPGFTLRFLLYTFLPLTMLLGFVGFNWMSARAKLETLKHGRVVEAEILSNHVNWASRMNGSPKHEIEYVVDGVLHQVSAFTGPITTLRPGITKALYNPKFPKSLLAIDQRLMFELSKTPTTEGSSGQGYIKHRDVLNSERLQKILKVLTALVWGAVTVASLAAHNGLLRY